MFSKILVLMLVRVVFFEVILLMANDIHKVSKVLIQIDAHRVIQTNT